MSNVLVELAVDPIGTDSTSESDFIVAAERVLRQAIAAGSSFQYQIGPMSTTIEGELYQVLSLVGQMHEAAFSEGAKRVLSTLRIDDRRDREPSISPHVDIVEKKLAVSKAQMC